MPKEFYTERDIEDMVRRGVMSLDLNDSVVLTELAYEKAQRLGVQLIRERPLEPPAAPVRPYISQVQKSVGGLQASSPVPSPAADANLAARIRDAVNARLGSQVDQALLDVIIQRVLRSTGVR